MGKGSSREGPRDCDEEAAQGENQRASPDASCGMDLIGGCFLKEDLKGEESSVHIATSFFNLHSSTDCTQNNLYLLEGGHNSSWRWSCEVHAEAPEALKLEQHIRDAASHVKGEGFESGECVN